jgi:excinuclease UvrABC ATPase subunit
VGAGTPEEIADNPASHTGRYLKRLLSAVSA